MASSNTSARDRLVLRLVLIPWCDDGITSTNRIMAETGLRRRAVSWLVVDNVYNRVNQKALNVCRAMEKGLVTRTFILGQETQRQLHVYIMEWHPGTVPV